MRVALELLGSEDRPELRARLLQDIAELDDLAEQLTIVDSGGSIQRAGFLQNLPGWWPYFWPVMFGGQLYDPATNRALIASPECVHAFEWVQT